MTASLIVDQERGSLVCTLSNPGARNALGPEMYTQLLDALDRANREPEIRCVILTGADGTFCAGGNLNRLLDNRSHPPAHQAASIDQLHTMTRAIAHCEKPVLAAIEGAAAGAGLSLALGCDLIIAARSSKFVMAYVKVGLSPDGGGSWFATRALPRQAALEMMLAGEPWGPERLFALGVVNEIVDDGFALPAALEWSNRLARLSPHAIKKIKRLVAQAQTTSLEQHLELEKESFVTCLHHADAGEAINAFLSKRTPNFPA
jgi:enoyl-CoA hydratase/carnithine racemase